MPKNTLDTAVEWFNDLNENKQVSLWNEYCERNYYIDDMLYTMDFVEEELKNHSAWELLTTHLVDTDCFSTCDKYASMSIYGWRSSDYPADLVDWDLDEQFLEYLYEWYIKEDDDDVV